LTQPATTANITPFALSGPTNGVTGITANDKVYDGTTKVTLNTNGTTLVGIFTGDTVALSTAGASGTFASKDVGNGISVTVSGVTVTGPQTGDYTLTQPAATANITPFGLGGAGTGVMGITADNKIYDATTKAALNTTGASLVGVFAGD